VTIEPGTLLADIAGTNVWQVNSRHHQAVKEAGSKSARVRHRRPGWDHRSDRTSRQAIRAGSAMAPEDQALHDAEQLKIFQRFGAAVG